MKKEKARLVDHAKVAWVWFGHSQTVAPLIPAALAAAVMGFLQYLSGWSAGAYWAAAIGAGLVVIVIFHLIPVGWARWVAFLVMICLASFLLYRGYQESLEYEIRYAGIAVDVGQYPTPTGQPQALNSVKVAVTFDNPNSFKVEGLSIRRYVSVARLVSGDEGEDERFVMPPKIEDHRNSDSVIRFPAPWRPNAAGSGTIDFLTCFGREEGMLDKSFRMKGRLEFTLTSNGQLQRPDFYPAEPKEENFGFFEGCPR